MPLFGEISEEDPDNYQETSKHLLSYNHKTNNSINNLKAHAAFLKLVPFKRKPLLSIWE